MKKYYIGFKDEFYGTYEGEDEKEALQNLKRHAEESDYTLPEPISKGNYFIDEIKSE